MGGSSKRYPSNRWPKAASGPVRKMSRWVNAKGKLNQSNTLLPQQQLEPTPINILRRPAHPELRKDTKPRQERQGYEKDLHTTKMHYEKSCRTNEELENNLIEEMKKLEAHL